jgi:hypothetical protein
VSERVETKKKEMCHLNLCCGKNRMTHVYVCESTVVRKTNRMCLKLLQEKRERERGVHACHEENKIGSWILMSKDGMRTEVIVLDRCGKLPKVLFSNLSSSLALPLGVLQSHLQQHPPPPNLKNLSFQESKYFRQFHTNEFKEDEEGEDHKSIMHSSWTD